MIKTTIFLLFLILLTACNSGSGGDPADDGGGDTGGSIPTGATYTVTGTVTYDFVPISLTGLKYSLKTQLPVRNVTIQARHASTNAVVATSKTDDSGAFTLAVPQSVSSYYVAILSQMTSPSITVEDNTSSNAVYLAQGSNQTNSGNTALANINIPCGWAGTDAGGSYTSTRFAAPFAILDTIYTAHKKMLAARGTFTLPALKVNWSKNNYASGTYTPSTGAISTSHYDGTELYILGKENDDTDEFDHHVIVHEWGHFVEDKISRSDSLGGSHGSGDKLNMSLAFGEGWGNALSAIILDPEKTYLDSMLARQQVIGVAMNIESGGDPVPGWFSESSVQQLIFDVYDPANEVDDDVSLGLGPIIDVLSGPQKINTALTSIFSFMTYLKSLNASSAADIDTLVAAKDIDPIADIYGTGETHDGGDADSLPLFNVLDVNDTPVTIGLGGGTYRMNEMNNNRYFRFTATSNSTRLTVNCDDLCIIGVFRAGAFIKDTGTYTTTTLDVPTVSTREYVVLLTTDPDQTNGAGAITVTIKAKAQ